MTRIAAIVVLTVVAGPALSCSARGEDAGAESRRIFEEIVGCFQRQDATGVGRFHFKHFEKLDQSQCDRIALLAAQGLSLHPEMARIAPKDFFPYVRERATAPARDRWAVNRKCADILHIYLGEPRRVTESKVVSHLVAALDHPDPMITRYVFYALRNLTRHTTGEWYWGSGQRDDLETHNTLVKWWKDWLAAASDKHPIFDRELEKSLRDDLERAVALVAAESKDFTEMAMFSNHPEAQRIRVMPAPGILRCDFEPRLLALVWPLVPHERLPILRLRYEFRTIDLTEDEPAPRDDPTEKLPADKQPPARRTALPPEPQEIFTAPVEGTDIVFRAYLHSPDPKLKETLVRTLKRWEKERPAEK